MIENTIESRRSSLSFIGCKSGLSKWLEDLSKATSLFKSVKNLENATSLLEDSQIYELIYPAQSLMSDRLFEEISRRNEDSELEKLRFRKQNNHTKAHGSSDVTTINMLLSKEKYKANSEKFGLHRENRKKSTGNGLKDGISQAKPYVKLSTDLIEIENKFPVKSDVREKLLRNIINMHGREIEDNQLGQGLNTLKRVLQSPAHTSIERSKRAEKTRAFYKRAEDMNSSESEQNSFSIEKEHSPARYFKYFLSENMSEQFSRSIEGIPVSREFLENKSDEITEPNIIESNQHSGASVSNYLIHDLKPLDSEKQLIEDKEFIVSSGRISEQFSRPIKGISISKEFLEEMPDRTTDTNLTSSNLTKPSLSEPDQHSKSSFADSRTQAFKLLKPEKQLIENEEFKINLERISEQFSRHIECIPSSREFLEKKSGEMTEPNLLESNLLKSSQYSEASVSDYLIHDLKSLDSEKQLIENKEFKVSSGGISEQFPRHIEGISVLKRSLEEKLNVTGGHNPYFPADNASYNSKGLISKSNQLSERKRNQFDKNQYDRNQFDRNQFNKISDLDIKISESNKQSDLLSQTSVNLLIEKAYSNSIKNSDIKEENRELVLNLIEKLSQVMNQTNRDTAPKRQNIFNIHVSGESPTGENDLKNLSDRLVLILKDQARRHGIDLS